MKYKIGDIILYIDSPIYEVMGVVQQSYKDTPDYDLKCLSAGGKRWCCGYQLIDDETNYRRFDFMSEILGREEHGENI